MSDTNELTTTVSPEQSSDDSAVDDGVVVLTNGVRVLNATPHPFVFTDGTLVPPCGTLLNAIFDERPATDMPEIPTDVETQLGFGTVQFVRTEKVTTPEGYDFISAFPVGKVLFLGSAIAMEAYGFPVVMAIPTPETSGRGTPHAEKRMQIDCFTCR